MCVLAFYSFTSRVIHAVRQALDWSMFFRWCVQPYYVRTSFERNHAASTPISHVMVSAASAHDQHREKIYAHACDYKNCTQYVPFTTDTQHGTVYITNEEPHELDCAVARAALIESLADSLFETFFLRREAIHSFRPWLPCNADRIDFGAPLWQHILTTYTNRAISHIMYLWSFHAKPANLADTLMRADNAPHAVCVCAMLLWLPICTHQSQVGWMGCHTWTVYCSQRQTALPINIVPSSVCGSSDHAARHPGVLSLFSAFWALVAGRLCICSIVFVCVWCSRNFARWVYTMQAQIIDAFHLGR